MIFDENHTGFGEWGSMFQRYEIGRPEILRVLVSKDVQQKDSGGF